MRFSRGIFAAAVTAAAIGSAPASAATDGGDAREVARLHGISVPAAIDRMELEELGGQVSADAQRRWPGTFAGAWIDGERVALAFSDDAVSKVARLQAGFPRPGALHAVEVRWSEAQLEELQARMAADRDAAAAGRQGLPGIDGGRYGLDIDPKRNAVVLIADDPSAATVAAVRAIYGSAVVIERGATGGPNACSRTDCVWTLRSGLRVDLSNGGFCSTAFAVRNSSGNRNILSAGHCGGTTRYHGGPTVGSVLAEQNRWKVDAERIAVQGQFAARGYIFVDVDHKTRPVTSKSQYADALVDKTVCKSGQTTGKTCGVIKGKSYMPPWVQDGNDFLRIDSMCAKDGDSGSGVYLDNKAIGIVSGGDDDQICNNGNDFVGAGHIEFAENALNATVVTSEGAPTFQSITARSGQTWVTLDFSWPVSCGTVQNGDFVVRVQGLQQTIVAHTCSTTDSDTDPRFDLLLNTTLIAGTTIEVQLVGNVEGPDGQSVPLVTRSTTVAL